MKYSKAYDPNSCGYDTGSHGDWKEGAYTRVHRDQEIINSMRRWMGLSTESDPTMLGLGAHCAKTAETQII
jgi:hypothetical protein